MSPVRRWSLAVTLVLGAAPGITSLIEGTTTVTVAVAMGTAVDECVGADVRPAGSAPGSLRKA